MTSLSLRNETTSGGPSCAASDCENPIVSTGSGRPARYCSATCRVRAHRHRASRPVAEVAMGSATSRGRHPDQAWLVSLRRTDRNVIVATGLRRRDADRLADQINELLA